MATPQLTGDHPLQVEIVTHARVAWKGRADEVRVPGVLGEFGVLPGHALLLSATRAGVVVVQAGAQDLRFVIGEGFAEVGPDHLTLLVDVCDLVADVDKAAATAALAAAEQVLAQAAPDSPEALRARREAELSQARLQG